MLTDVEVARLKWIKEDTEGRILAHDNPSVDLKDKQWLLEKLREAYEAIVTMQTAAIENAQKLDRDIDSLKGKLARLEEEAEKWLATRSN